MATITTIQETDYQDDSRTDINNNFDNLNTDKVEKSGDTMTGELSFSGTDHAGIKVNSLTTAQRDALTPANGMVIYNSTTSAFETYQNDKWTATTAPSFTTAERDALDVNNGTVIYNTTTSKFNFYENDVWVEMVAVKFGGTGADGALEITSGTTTIDCAGENIVIKNYTSISITGTGKLAFSNPHNNGTIVVLKSQGNVTLTSSEAPMIDMSGMGAVGATGPVSNTAPDNENGSAGTTGYALSAIDAPTGGLAGFNAGEGNNPTPAGGGTSIAIPSALKKAYLYSASLFLALQRYQHAFTGSGGGSGSFYIANGTCAIGNAGRGGGGLIIECGGYWNFTTAGGISVGGTDASAVASTATIGAQSGSGGGGGGFFQALYNFLTANTGTVTVAGGQGANGAVQGGNITGQAPGGGGAGYNAGEAGTSTYVFPGTGGDGGDGVSLIAQNTEFI